MGYLGYQIIYKESRKEFVELLSKGVPTHGYRVSDPVSRETIHGGLRQYAEKKWKLSQLVWKKLLGGNHIHSILEISTPMGRCIIMRNGNNVGRYNYAVLDPQSGIHFAQNSLEACDLVNILGADRDEVPLFVGQIDNPRLLPALERRLKHAA